MRLIVTRPEQDAASLVAKLRAASHDGIAVPLIQIEYLHGAEIEERDWQAILITSANSIRALVELKLASALLQIPVLTVGPASTAAASDAGFASVTSADGDLPALVSLALELLDADKGPLLYPSGVTISGDLKGLLEDKGFACARTVLYDAVRAKILPSAASEGLLRKEVDGVVLYSPRTAKIWTNCVKNETLLDTARQLSHWCLSNAVATALRENWPSGTPPARVQVASEPNEASLLEAICASNGR